MICSYSYSDVGCFLELLGNYYYYSTTLDLEADAPLVILTDFSGVLLLSSNAYCYFFSGDLDFLDTDVLIFNYFSGDLDCFRNEAFPSFSGDF